MTPPAASSNSAATADLKSTGSGAATGRREGVPVAVGQSLPLAAVLDAGATSVVPSAEAPAGGSLDARSFELGPPYFGRLDLAAEDKIRAFDQFSSMVCAFIVCFSSGARQCSRWE